MTPPGSVRPGDVIELDGEPFGVVLRTCASSAAPWAYSDVFRGRREFGRVVVIAPFVVGEAEQYACILARRGAPFRVLGFVVARVGKARGRELVIPRRSRVVGGSPKSRRSSTR